MKIKVLFVCLGNICRSPMAEGVFANAVRQRGLEKMIDCDSAGTAGYHIGSDPDKRTLQVLKENGLTTKHKGRKLENGDLLTFDYLIVMDQNNYKHVEEMIQKKPGKASLFLFREFDSTCEDKKPVPEVPDPYYGTMNDFKLVFEQCERSSEGLLEFIINKHSL